MKIIMIYGQIHKGISYTIAHSVLKHLRINELEDSQVEIKEFFLPKDGPDFCVGCNQCFLKGEEHCPEAKKVQPIMRAIEWADIIIIASPNYVMEMSGSLKNLFDHLAYRWVTHRPHPTMFSKVGVVISSSAGAPPNGTVKSMAKQLKWMCVPKVYKFPFISNAMGVADLAIDKRNQIEKKAAKIAKQIRHSIKRPSVGLRTKAQFLLFRRMQIGEAAAWNSTDQNWWIEYGWTKKTRPWKVDKN